MEDFRDVHHRYWPRRSYQDKVGREFRELPCNKVQMWRSEHNKLHATTPAPKKPNRNVMLAVIQAHRQGRCNCHEEAR